MSQRVFIHGLAVTVENPKGSIRSGIGPGGSWQTVLRHDYGDVPGITGADSDSMDVFLGDNHDSPSVYVVNQNKPDGSRPKNCSGKTLSTGREW